MSRGASTTRLLAGAAGRRLLLAVVVGGLAAAATAQSPAFVQWPAPTPSPAPPSRAAPSLKTCNGPIVDPDRSVTFCLSASPQATSVVLLFQSMFDKAPTGLPIAMAKQESGIWAITLAPLDPNYYGYAFAVDGTQLADPANRVVSLFQAPPVWPGPSSAWNFVFVPGPAADYMDEMPDVPHGLVAKLHYHSTVLNSPQEMLVYTPPGYGRGSRNYPVLYLYAGGGGMNTDWPVNMRANFILDNLIANGSIEPMIVAMPEYDLRNCPNFTSDPFAQQLLVDVVPTVEHSFHVLRGTENRALAGLSSGAGCVYNSIFKAPGEFAYFGLFSPNWPSAARADLEQNHQALLSPAAADKINKATRLLWITKGGDSDNNQVADRQALLNKYKIVNTYTPGSTYGANYGHVWDTWRKALMNFSPRLFGKIH